jgi:hypothetical protein
VISSPIRNKENSIKVATSFPLHLEYDLGIQNVGESEKIFVFIVCADVW